tara:strand:- start:368 stop:928 length:561 start_codon:yes stop_codon:yes gene_type:complete
MRIISGVFKGRSIEFLKNSNTRPLKDSVRENIFNLLKHSNRIEIDIENSNVLDVYCGIGSFGIECLSRGAQQVTFIDQDFKASSILKQNLIKLSLLNKSKIILSKIEDFLINDTKEKFNIFFFDPPFKDLHYLDNIKIIKEKKFFHKNHVVIAHRERSSQDELIDLLKIIETKQYGRSKILFGIFK